MSEKIKHLKLVLLLVALTMLAVVKNQISNHLRGIVAEIYVKFIEAESLAKVAQDQVIRISQILNIAFLIMLALAILFSFEYVNKLIRAAIISYVLLVGLGYFVVSFLV